MTMPLPHPAHEVTPPVALTIAGSDSGGGAGIQADLRAFGQHGTFGTSVLTAVTAQNTVGVTAVHVVPTEVVTAQLDAVLDDLPVAAVKTGMLGSAELVELVAERADAGDLPHLVVDPVMVSATGARLVDPDAVAVYRRRLLPLATVITPNLPEAAALLGRDLPDRQAQHDAARELAAEGAEVVVVKGGHLDDGDEVVDVVAIGDEVHELVADRVVTGNTHGTGCTFAAATAAGLARGRSPLDALTDAKTYVTRCLLGAAGWQLGAGNGPLDHLHEPTGPAAHRRSAGPA